MKEGKTNNHVILIFQLFAGMPGDDRSLSSMACGVISRIAYNYLHQNCDNRLTGVEVLTLRIFTFSIGL